MSEETPVTNLFWDSCVFIRFLTGNKSTQYWADIRQYLEDSVSGTVAIFASTIVMAEVKPSHLTGGGYGNFQDFMDDFSGAFTFIDPSPDIMLGCAAIRDFTYPNPHKSTGGTPANDRSLGIADAIHLLTCVYVRDQLGISDIKFHTMDDGKTKGVEGKCVPLLSFDKWVNGIPKNDYTGKICALPRTLPLHPQPKLVS